MIDLPERLTLAQRPTPLQCLTRFSQQLGGPRIWVKRDDQTGCATGGNKIRKLEFTLHKALASGCDTIITCGGLQSNHCRATALLGAQLGLQVHLLLRGEDVAEAEGNLLLDQLAGADIHCYPASQYQADLAGLQQSLMQRLQERGLKPWLIPTGASDGHGVWGYLAASLELQQDFADHGIDPSYCFVASGSGGTQAGLTAGFELLSLPAQVWGLAVCDSERYFQDKVRHDLQQWAQWYAPDYLEYEWPVRVIDRHIGPGYAVADDEVFATIKQVASMEGLVLDPVYSGKAFHGMVKELQSAPFCQADDVVFIHTGGLFGLFPQRQQLYRQFD